MNFRRSSASEVRQQKLRHLNTHGIDWKANIVDRASYKKDYARADALLIDDYQANTDAFIAAGGKAILYTTFDLAIDQIKSFIGE